MTFREIIQKALKNRTTVELADFLNTSRSNIIRWKNGDSEPIEPMKEVYIKKLRIGKGKVSDEKQ